VLAGITQALGARTEAIRLFLLYSSRPCSCLKKLRLDAQSIHLLLPWTMQKYSLIRAALHQSQVAMLQIIELI